MLNGPPIFAFSVWLHGYEEIGPALVNHVDRAKAHSDFISNVGDLFRKPPWDRLRSVLVGPPITSARLLVLGRQRGIGWFAAGVRVRHEYDGSVGTLLDARGGYASVLFDDRPHSLPVHPGELHPLAKGGI